MTSQRTLCCSGLLLLLFCSLAPSDDKPPKATTEVVNKTFASLAKAINARDPQAISGLFTPTGEFIDGSDNVFQGRAAIAGEFTALFGKNPKSTIELAADEIREISAGVVTVEGLATMTAAEAEGKADEKEPVHIEFTALLVRQSDGGWLLASVRSEGEQDDDEPTPHGHLKDLEWLIGDWVDESHESTTHTSIRWSEDGNFILSEFAIRIAGRKAMSGTQRIGWDASLEKFRSWVFDSQGGHAEGVWTELDGRWVVKATGVRADGQVGSATQIYEPNGADAYVFSILDRIVGDEEQPDVTIRVVRKPPEPEAASTAAATPPGK